MGGFRSGFCTPGNDDAAHQRCRGSYEGRECVCEHHAAAEAIASDDAAIIEGRASGLVRGMPEAEYHAHPTSLSVSGAKVLLKAPALYKWEREHAVFKKAFEIGKAAHAKVLGVGAEIRVIPAEMLGKNGAASTDAAKAFIETARKEGAVPLKAAQARAIDDMAEKVSAHSFAMELLSKDPEDSEPSAEVSAFADDEVTGVRRRCRFDWFNPVIPVDFKTSATADPEAFRHRAYEYGYFQQAAWYLDMARDLGYPAEAFAFIVQMTDPPYLVTVVELRPRALDRGRELNRRALEMFRDCTESGIWPGYVPDTDFAKIDLPPRAYVDSDVEIAS